MAEKSALAPLFRIPGMIRSPCKFRTNVLVSSPWLHSVVRFLTWRFPAIHFAFWRCSCFSGDFHLAHQTVRSCAIHSKPPPQDSNPAQAWSPTTLAAPRTSTRATPNSPAASSSRRTMVGWAGGNRKPPKLDCLVKATPGWYALRPSCFHHGGWGNTPLSP